jgi:hypothetical protein
MPSGVKKLATITTRIVGKFYNMRLYGVLGFGRHFETFMC